MRSSPLSFSRLAAVTLCAYLGFTYASPAAEPLALVKAEDDRIQFEAFLAPAGDPFSPYNLASIAPGTRFTPPEGKLQLRRGATFYIVVMGTPKPTFHTYPLTRRTSEQSVSQLGTLTLEGKGFTPLWPILESEAEFKDEGQFGGVLFEHEKPFVWIQEVYLKPDAPISNAEELVLKIHSQQCSEKRGCRWNDFTLRLPFTVSDETPLVPSADLTKQLQTKVPQPEIVSIPASARSRPETAPTPSSDTKSSSTPSTEQTGLLASILKAILGGFASLLTPCVFPMIPITVSIFLKKSEAKEGGALVHACVYSLTIVLVLTVAGVALLGVLIKISTHYLTNYLLGAIFIFFALSLLGMYEIVLPSRLANVTSSREGKGGMLGTVFQALTFSVLSFACVGPVFGGFIALEASGNSVLGWISRILPVLAFSLAFASPFFVLALFPKLLKSMPRSGSWMNSIKVVMGFLELAAAFKFLRAGELYARGKTEILTFDLALGVYIALSFACGLYLLNVYRLPHDHSTAESIGVSRLLFSITFITLGLYLLPGLFKNGDGEAQKPHGQVYEWVESFLLPDIASEGSSSGAKSGSTRTANGRKIELEWMTNVEEAQKRAAQENKPMFFDFTGIGCTNCKKNEGRAFTQRKIKELFAQFVLVRLHTDTVPAGIDQVPDANGSLVFRRQKFETGALPYYEIVTPQGNRLSPPIKWEENLIDDVDDFARFLQNGLDAAKKG